MRQPPSSAAVAWKSSSKPSSGVGRTSRRATSRRPAAGTVALARRVAAGRDRVVDLDEVGDDLEARRARGRDVARPLGDGRVRVVDHERHPRLEAGLQERRLAGARAQQVHRDPRVRLEEAVAVERRLARALHAAEDHGLHVREDGISDAASPRPSASRRSRSGALPRQLAGLTVEAALTGAPRGSHQAAMLDPHTAAELSLDEIAALVDDLLTAHGEWIPSSEH